MAFTLSIDDEGVGVAAVAVTFLLPACFLDNFCPVELLLLPDESSSSLPALANASKTLRV